MLDANALRSIRPFVATPTHSGQLTSGYVRSLLALSNLAWTHGFSMISRFRDGDALITRARNELVAEFMADSHWTHLFWIDADISFEPEAALRLLVAGKDVAAGACPRKTDGWPETGLAQAVPAGTRQADFESRHASFNVVPLAEAQTVDPDGFVRVKYVGTGFMVVSRRVFHAMSASYANLRYHDHSPGADPTWTRYRFYDVDAEQESGAYLSEDFAFCQRWRAIGGNVHVDTHSNLTHTGTKNYHGQFVNALTVL